MCYEFDHACNGHLIDEITKTAGEEAYFLVCKKRYNYFYSPYLDAIVGTMQLLTQKGIVLKRIEDNPMINVVNSRKKIHKMIHGSTRLFNNFRLGYCR